MCFDKAKTQILICFYQEKLFLEQIYLRNLLNWGQPDAMKAKNVCALYMIILAPLGDMAGKDIEI